MHLVFIGTSTKTTSRGVYVLRLDDANGALGAPLLVADLTNPSFLALHPNGRVLYAIGECGTIDEKPAGHVYSYALEAATGCLTLLNQQPSRGISLTHLAADAIGRTLIAVSYSGGYIVSFPLDAGGHLGAVRSFITPQGPLGPNRTRQDQSHAHSVTLAPDHRFAFVADLGLDRVYSYRLDAARATLTPNDPPFITIAPGAGPRHSKFSHDGTFFYVLNEIDGSVTVCAYDPARGAGIPIQHISTLPAGFKVSDSDRAAEIRIHPNDRFVYCSNRGHDSLAVFARDPATGRLTLVEITPCGGKTPRNFELSPSGNWLVCAHQDSDTISVFKVDSATGHLTPNGSTISMPQPNCVLFAAASNLRAFDPITP